MHINKINNNLSLQFNGLLKLNAGLEVRGPGFPEAPDAIDIFSYVPFKDDTPESIEMDKIKLQQLDGYLETQELEKNKFALRQINAQIAIHDALPDTQDEYEKKQINPSEKKLHLNISNISPEEIVDKVKEMKKNLRKGLGQFIENGSLLLFKYM